MAARVVSVAFEGVEARRVDVEVQTTGGLPNFVVVGLADKAVGEARERVRAAFMGLGLALPAKRIVTNLAPADLPKEGNRAPHHSATMAALTGGGTRVKPGEVTWRTMACCSWTNCRNSPALGSMFAT